MSRISGSIFYFLAGLRVYARGVAAGACAQDSRSGFRFDVAALNQHKGHEGHQDKTSSFPFVSFVSFVFDQRSGSNTPPTRKRRIAELIDPFRHTSAREQAGGDHVADLRDRRRRDELTRDGSGRIERRADDPRLGRHGALRHRARRLTAPRDGSPLPTASACSPTSRTVGTYARGESRAAREDSGRILPGAVLLRRPRNVVLRAWRHPGLHGARPAGHPRLRPAFRGALDDSRSLRRRDHDPRDAARARARREPADERRHHQASPGAVFLGGTRFTSNAKAAKTAKLACFGLCALCGLCVLLRYSHRNATIASTRDAWRAGTYPATIVTASTASVAASTVAGSYGLTSNNCARSSRAAASAIGMPSATPVTTIASVSRRIMRWMTPPLAPSAMRTPISRVRRATAYAIVP